jgi:PAS domain S-box-containing protein
MLIMKLKQRDGWVLPGITALALGTFVVDLFVPRSTPHVIFYVIPVVLTLYVRGRLWPLVFGAGCSVLMIAGYLLSPPGEVASHWALFGRGMGVGVLWLLAGVVYQVNRAEAKRQGAAARLQLQTAALEATANAIVITDRAGSISWVNPAFTRSTGYALDEVVGQNPRLLKSGKHDKSFYRNLWATILAGRAWQGELINRHKDGELSPQETTITPVRGAGGDITHFIGVKQDLSERKRAQEDIRTLSRFPDENPHPVLRFARDCTLLYANVSARKLCQCLDWSVGRPVSEKWAKLICEALASGMGNDVEVVCGETVYSLSFAPILEAGYVNVYGRDVTDRQHLETQLRQAQKMEAIGQLAGGVADRKSVV